MDIGTLLRQMIDARASDLFVKAKQIPFFRVDGLLEPAGDEVIEPELAEHMAREILGERAWSEFEKNWECDTACEIKDLGRFRVNAFRQLGRVSLAVRRIPSTVFTFEDLNLPAEPLKKLAEVPRGLILVTGTTGSGKSTTLATMINYMNKTQARHIITIEDPVEYVFRDERCLIEQREVGIDTKSFHEALKHVLRQGPDVIMIGEMRDRETMEVAVNAVETGHVVMSTLHTTNASQTIERIINFFPAQQQPQLRVQLSLCLKGIISQRLLRRASGQGMIPAVELLLNSPTVQKLIAEGRFSEIPVAIESGRQDGMQTFQQSLLELYEAGEITYEEGLRGAESVHEFGMLARGVFAGRNKGPNADIKSRFVSAAPPSVRRNGG